MVSFKTYILLKSILIWNTLANIYNITIKQSTNIFNYIKDYIYGYNDMWIFVPGHTFPLSLTNLNNLIYVYWMYDNNTSILAHNASTSLNMDAYNLEDYNTYKLSWLSAKIIIKDSDSNKIEEYNIDDFIDTFRVHIRSNNIPTLYTIFMCWCIYTKYWFKLNDMVELYIINDMGDDITININDPKNRLCIKGNMLDINNIDLDYTEIEHIYISNSHKDDSTTFI